MAGQLAIDFGNAYTVAAFWRQAAHQAETLYLPGVTRPLPGGTAGKGKGVFAAPSLIAYSMAAEPCLIGQEAVESSLAEHVFHDLQFAVVTGKRVCSLVGGQWISSQDMAKDYLVAYICRASQAVGLGDEAVITFTIPLAACNSEAIWRRYRCWLEGAVSQAGFNRLELVEEPWAAAWGAGMKVKPEDIYLVVKINAGFMEAATVQAANQSGEAGGSRHVRMLSYRSGWSVDEPGAKTQQEFTGLLRQVVQEATLLGYLAERFVGAVIIGSDKEVDMLASVHEVLPVIPIYNQQPWSAVACGAAVLTAGVDGCGYLQNGYALRYLAEDGYHYRELVPQGLFYPSDGSIAEFTIKASYDGQREFAVLLYRRERCINEDDPLLLTTELPAAKGQAVITVKASLDGAGQLMITAWELTSGHIIAHNKAAAKLV